jgi:serine/threonine-protein kinase
MARSASEQRPGDGTRFGESESKSVGPAQPSSALKAGSPRVGDVIDGKYRIEGLLGEGGMGAVWWAQHIELDRPVAIKLLRPGPDRATLSERLKIEARAAARLVHPAIVRVFDIDTSEAGEPYIVMELLKGESLAGLLERGRVSGAHAVQLALPIAEGLALAHAHGIVHRDLKPPNVFLAEEGDRLQPKLLDFGIAKLTAPHAQGSLTDTGVTVGSPDYMSPEQARGSNDVDHRADIWAFSVMLYEAVTGFVPFDGDNYNALMRSIVEDDPRPIPVEDELDPGLVDLIFWGLAKERKERPQSIHELGRELARWLLDRGITEDVCGTPLGPKWITRVAQKSPPVIEESRQPRAAPTPPTPPPVVRGDTLVSPRHPSRFEPAPQVETLPPARDQQRRVPWTIAVALLVAVAAGAWFLGSRPAAVPPASSAARPASLPALGPAERQPALEPALPAEAAPSVVRIANTAPGPSASPRALATQRPRDNVNSAPLGSAALKQRDDKSVHEGTKAPSAAKPATDARDETRELLQAY